MISPGSVHTGPGTMIGWVPLSRSIELWPWGPPAQQHRVTGGIPTPSDRRTDGAGTDDCNTRSDVTEVSKPD
ncbi:MAG: hypothetical protein J2P17_23585 [Mycobacterium sp.]|nr:hypothetical protein [Mycobacterium sp.]